MDCYADDAEERVMSNMYISDDMTSAIYRDHCKDKNALYYATQVQQALRLALMCALFKKMFSVNLRGRFGMVGDHFSSLPNFHVLVF